jgi:hypothetical protein
VLLGACGKHASVWREQTLPSGKVVKVTACHLAWGLEHDERTPGADSFALEFVYTRPDAPDA